MDRIEEQNEVLKGVGQSYDLSPKTEPLWTVQEVAEYLRLEPETIRNMAREGKLPALKVGRVWRFKRLLIKSWVEQQVEDGDKSEVLDI